MRKNLMTAGAVLLCAVMSLTGCDQIASQLDNPVSAYLEIQSAPIAETVPVGTTYQIEATTISTMPIQFTSSDPNVVTVDADGLVTAVADGDATITVSVDQDANHAYQAGEQQIKVSVRTPLSFEAKEDGQISVLYLDGITLDKPIVYTIAGKETEITASKTFEVKKGDVVEFRSANDHMGTAWGYGGYVNIYPSAECAVYGNVMSLITDGDFLENTTITQDGAFYRLFAYSNNMVNHEKYELRLPATELTTACYQYMFYACQKLTKAPALPATEMKDACYESMFSSCTALTEAPALPATNLSYACYWNMFNSCSKLVKAPALPATTMAHSCYNYMFAYCTSLAKAPALPAKSLQDYCYRGMFRGCSNLTEAPALPATTVNYYSYNFMFAQCTKLKKAPALPATTLDPLCYYSMFSSCTALTEAPALPATKVNNQSYNSMFAYCTNLTTAPVLPAPTPEFASYYRMFIGCSKLNSVTCLATDISADYCVMYWLDDVAETGTFTKASTVDDDFWAGWIPGGWTVKSAAAAASAPAAHRAASAPEFIPLQEPEPFGVKAPATMSTPRKI